MKSNSNLIWIDLEMTGLDCQNDVIIEIATVITDAELNIVAEGPVLAIFQEAAVLDQMDSWNQNQHRRSGLYDRVLKSQLSTEEAERATIKFIQNYISKGISPMAGNSICQDRRFLARLMPELESWFHYRNLDVSTLKELAKKWYPDIYAGFSKEGAHLALDDIYESIRELEYYQKNMFIQRVKSS